jgi:hypothetical protein
MTFFLCSGGLELLFGNEKVHEVDVPAQGGQVLFASHLRTWLFVVEALLKI